MAELPDDTHYLYVGVGDRAFWKDQSCIFRTSPKTQLKRWVIIELEDEWSHVALCNVFSVPTLIKWGTKLRLEEGQLMKEDMVKMMLED